MKETIKINEVLPEREQAILDTALLESDQLLARSLHDDQRRRRRRTWLLVSVFGGVVMSVLILAFLLGWFTLTVPVSAETEESTSEPIAAKTAEKPSKTVPAETVVETKEESLESLASPTRTGASVSWRSSKAIAGASVQKLAWTWCVFLATDPTKSSLQTGKKSRRVPASKSSKGLRPA